MNKTAFEWPTPPYFNIALDSDIAEPETCIIYLRNGTKILGDLVQFLPEESSILFLPIRKENNEVIHFKEIKSIKLMEPLLLKKTANLT